jgi:hypothetical protein
VGSPVYRIQAGKGIYDQLKPRLVAQGATQEQLSLWGQHIALVDAPIHLTVFAGEGVELPLVYWPFAEILAKLGKSLRAIGLFDINPVPFSASEEMEPYICMMEGLEELLGMYRFIHIPRLGKTFTQDILSPYFARKQQPRKQELASTGNYEVTLYQDSFAGRLNRLFGKS